MIGKITKGKRVGDIAAYLHGPGRNNEHSYNGKSGGMVIGGNLGREGATSYKGWAADMWGYTRHSEAKKPIWQVSLRNHDADRVMSDAEWAEAGQMMAEDMNFTDRPWVMVRHADDHVHLVMCRVNEAGQLWRDRDEKGRGNDYQRMMQSKAKLEKHFGLMETSLPEKHEEAKDKAGHKLTQGEHHRAVRTGETPPRVLIAEHVRTAAEAGKLGGGMQVFEQQLEGLGVEYNRSTTKAGKVRGYSFHLPGDVDKAGEKIFYPASKLDKSLSWTKLGPELAAAPKISPPEQMNFGRQMEAAEDAVELAPMPKKRLITTKKRHSKDVEETKQDNEKALEAARQKVLEQERAKHNRAYLPSVSAHITKSLDKTWEKRRERAGKTRDERLRIDAKEQQVQLQQPQQQASKHQPPETYEQMQQRMSKKYKQDFENLTRPTRGQRKQVSRPQSDRELGG